jgi:hypothetical protein
MLTWLAEGKSFSAAELVAAVAWLAARYAKSNVVGTILGQGVRGTGLKLWRQANGRIAACRENAALVLVRATADQVQRVVDELALSSTDELVRKLEELPSIDAPTA